MLDSGASHNLMPKSIMLELGLEIIKPYHDICFVYSHRFKCLVLIKDIIISHHLILFLGFLNVNLLLDVTCLKGLNVFLVNFVDFMNESIW